MASERLEDLVKEVNQVLVDSIEKDLQHMKRKIKTPEDAQKFEHIMKIHMILN